MPHTVRGLCVPSQGYFVPTAIALFFVGYAQQVAMVSLSYECIFIWNLLSTYIDLR